MIYFIADTHFGHENVIRFCDRPFSSADDMDEAMIANWNARVRGNDTVYILGDMFFRSTNAEAILQRLRGKKRLIVGNHDGSWMAKFDYARYFVSVDNFLETSDGQHSLTLCHYPLLSWKHARRSYMIHGIVFWTKNPIPMLHRLSELDKYNYYFQFTLNAYDRDVEPSILSKNNVIIDL